MVLLITSAIICSEGKVLLLKRNREPEKGKWSLPGGVGSLKKYPNPVDAVKNEVKYDLGVAFIVDSFFDYSFYEGKEGPAVVLHFIGKITGKPILNKTEIVDWKFFSQKELPDEIAFNNQNILKKFFENEKNK